MDLTQAGVQKKHSEFEMIDSENTAMSFAKSMAKIIGLSEMGYTVIVEGRIGSGTVYALQKDIFEIRMMSSLELLKFYENGIADLLDRAKSKLDEKIKEDKRNG